MARTEQRPVIRVFNLVEVVTTAYRDLFPDWVARGYHVEVVMSGYDYRTRDLEWCVDGVDVIATPAFARFGRVGAIAGYLLVAPLRTMFGRRAHVNLFLTQPPIFFLWGWCLRLLGRGPYKVLTMDLYPDIAIASGVVSGESKFVRLLARVGNFGLKRADGIIAIGRHMTGVLTGHGVRKDQITVVPNWSDETLVQPVPMSRNAVRVENGWTDKFVVLYSGNMGTPHEFDSILEVARRSSTDNGLVFAFAGAGSRRQEIEAMADQVDNIELLPFADLERLGEALSAADLHFVSLADGFEGLSVPSKFYGILAAGGALIYQGDQRSEIARVIAEEQIGWSIPSGDVDALEAAVKSAISDPAGLAEARDRARALAEGRFSKGQALERYASVLELVPHRRMSGLS